MNHSNRRAWAAGCAMAVATLLLTSCTAGDGEGKAEGSSQSPVPSTTATKPGPSDTEAMEQARAALDAVQSGKLFAAGTERVTDGVHTQTVLSKGKTYKLNLVCLGTGSAQLSFTPARSGRKASVPCDRSLVQQRLTGDGQVRINLDAVKDATGVIAWRIDAQ